MLRALVTITRRNLLTTGKIPRNYSSGKKASDKVPSKPVWELVQSLDLEERTNFNPDLIHNLERLSLVEFGNREGLARLCAAIDLADQLQLVDTEGVEPMDSLHEDMRVYLRQDVADEGNCRGEVMRNAQVTFEEYFVAPPGNIALTKSSNYDD